MLSIIVAVAENNAIGRDNELLWHISEDLKYFKETTMGHPVIMGRKTFESIGRPLPGRENIILSRSGIELPEIKPFKKDGTPSKTKVSIENNLESLMERCKNSSEEYFVIGGGSVYKRAFGFADRLYLTKIYSVADNADTFFPEVSADEWKLIRRSGLKKDDENSLNFESLVYQRV